MATTTTPAATTTTTTTAAAPATVDEQRAARFRPSPAGWVGRGAVLAALAAVVLIVPALRDPSDVRLFAQAVIYAVIGLSLNVLLGYTGQISLGHQAFVGVGAFTSAYMVTVQAQPFFLAVLVAMIVGAVQAAILGGVSLRIRGLYFALITLSFGIVAEESLFAIESLTGGGAGQPAPLPAGFSTPYRYYYLCLAVLAVVLWVDYRMMKSKGGRALLALRENPRVAATFGIDVRLFTMFSFVVAGVFAALGGALLAHNSEIVVASVFDFRLALVFVIMTVVGGLRSRTGVVIGSAFFALLGYLIEVLHVEGALKAIPFAPDLSKELAPLVLGPVLLLLTLTLYPGGIGQQVLPIQRWLRGERFDLSNRGEKEVQV
ncbi:MAG TPA: branched-chain amino acid ABC transporter permease, partial [Nonomuraea sp.]|nr:branched-chain amino acid ABC transporter permease [Nonomuraea sp.]